MSNEYEIMPATVDDTQLRLLSRELYRWMMQHHGVNYKRLANAKRPCDWSVLCLRPKCSLCSCPNCILDITWFRSFGSADSVRRASNNGVGQFKPTFRVERNILRPIFFGYFIDDWLLYNFAAGIFIQQNFVADFIRLKSNIRPIPKNWKIGFWATVWGTYG